MLLQGLLAAGLHRGSTDSPHNAAGAQPDNSSGRQRSRLGLAVASGLEVLAAGIGHFGLGG
jgi:hypothetical protein